jgi:predicted nucleic acid-binding protein
VSRGLLDTSVFIAREQRRRLRPLPDDLAVSVITIGELELGVLAAGDPDQRARRADTLALARAADPIAVTEAVMGAFARLTHDCRKAGARPKILDALIASTAIEHGLPVVTQDDDFETMARAHPRLFVQKV